MPKDDSALAGLMLNKALKEACESPRRRPWASWLIGVIFGLLGLTAVAWGVFWLYIVMEDWPRLSWAIVGAIYFGRLGFVITGLIAIAAAAVVLPDRNLPRTVRLGITGTACAGCTMQIIVLALSLIAS